MIRVMVMSLASLVNLNQPGHYLHWSIFTISVANLVIIAVMVIIFGLALLLPFPKGRRDENDESHGTHLQERAELAAYNKGFQADDNKMWTARVRNFALRILPPGKLMPDRQPAYVASWIYVFGVATLAALAMVIISGTALAVGGPDW